MKDSKLNIAVLIPCRNEELTVGQVIAGFRSEFPESTIYVCDNASTDQTSSCAVKAGAKVLYEPIAGKGRVLRRMFSDIEADIYILVDGDGTYDPAEASFMVKTLLDEGLDMVTGSRTTISAINTRRSHVFGNSAFNYLYRFLFGAEFSDIFTGYRILSRRLVKSFPALSSGFEIETELSVHASQLCLPVAEVPVSYRARPEGSKSKLRTIPDGFRILRSMISMLKENRPFFMFGSLSLLSCVTATVLAIPLIVTYVDTGLVPRLPTAVLSASLILLSLLLMVAGLILDSVTKSRIEVKRIAYLQS